MSEEYIAGRNPVLEVLRSGRSVNRLWVAEGAGKGPVAQVLAMAKEARIQVQFVPRKKLDQIAEGEAHQGVIAFVAAYDYVEVEDILRRAEERKEDPFILILDEIEDPHNLGSILRTADAVGAHGVIIPKRRAVGLTSTVAKSSAGAMEYVPVARVTNMVRAMEELKERGIWLAGTDASGEQDFRQGKYDLPLGLVIGSEGRGMSRLVRETCDFVVRLPMVGHVTSLNASVAAGLLMFEVYRQRHPVGTPT